MANGLGLGPIKQPLFFNYFFVQSPWSVVLFLRETHPQDQTWLVSSCCSCRPAAQALACTFSLGSGHIGHKKAPPKLSTDFAQSPSPPVSVSRGPFPRGDRRRHRGAELCCGSGGSCCVFWFRARVPGAAPRCVGGGAGGRGETFGLSSGFHRGLSLVPWEHHAEPRPGAARRRRSPRGQEGWGSGLGVAPGAEIQVGLPLLTEASPLLLAHRFLCFLTLREAAGSAARCWCHRDKGPTRSCSRSLGWSAVGTAAAQPR